VPAAAQHTTTAMMAMSFMAVPFPFAGYADNARRPFYEVNWMLLSPKLFVEALVAPPIADGALEDLGCRV
jgi:hypothetical protein